MALVRLRVIIGNERFPAGSTVLVRANHTSAPWAKEVFEFEGVDEPFIFIPESSVSVMEKAGPHRPGLAQTSVAMAPAAASNQLHVAG
jgi:hypothetical protein